MYWRITLDVSRLNFSLDAATSETFLRIRGKNFERIIRNIQTYIERFESRRDRMWISLSFVITKSNVKEMTLFVSLAKKLKANAVKFYRLHEYDGLDWQITTETGDVFITGRSARGSSLMNSTPGLSKPVTLLNSWGCT